MIGIPNSDPNTPGFVIVNVPPSTSSGLSCLARARAARSADRPAQTQDIQLVGAFDHRNDEPLLQRDGDPEIDLFSVHDLVAIDRCVDDRNCAERVGRDLGDKGQVRQLAVRARGRGSPGVSDRGNGRKIDLEHRMHMCRGPAARNHPLGNLPPHGGHRDDLGLLHRTKAPGTHPGGKRLPRDHRPGRGPGPSFDVLEDVVFGHPAASPRASDLRDVDALLPGDPPDEG